MTLTGSLSSLEDLPSTLATFRFINDSPLFQTEKPYEIVVGNLPPEEEWMRQNVTFSEHSEVPVYDLRAVFHHLELESHALCFLKCPWALSLDIKEDNGLKAYLKMIKELLQEQMNAEAVVIFDYNVCSSPGFLRSQLTAIPRFASLEMMRAGTPHSVFISLPILLQWKCTPVIA